MPSLSLQLPPWAMATMPPLASQPASACSHACSVDLAALVSPALHSLGFLQGGSLPPSAAKQLPPWAVGPSPRPCPSPRLAISPKMAIGGSPKGFAPQYFSGERSPFGERSQLVQPSSQMPPEPPTPQEVAAC